MRSPFLSLAAGLALAVATATLTGASIVDVAVGGGGFSFSPQTVHIQAGDSVRFTNQGGMHNVAADDGSFRCSETCSGVSAGPSSAAWSFTQPFNQAGTFGYHCEMHGSPGGGMFGTVVVSAPASQPGALGFDQTSYSRSEAGGAATITVERRNGDSGAVSVHYATSNGSAIAGQDYTAAAGTLSWADGDETTKTFQVPITNDTLQEPNETVHLTLSAPTGGATLGTASALLTIVDNDGGGGGTPPAAPTGLKASATSTSDIHLQWTDASNNETGFRVQMRPLDGSPFADAPGSPLAAGSTSATISGLDAGTGYAFRVRAENGAGNSAFSAEASAATDTALPAACTSDATTQCLSSRFRASIVWKTSTANGAGNAVPIPSAPQSGLFYFFGASNIEMLLKVLNACTPTLGNKYWVFFAATTNVQFTLTVVDTQTGKTRVYFNPLGQAAAPVQDTSAFATCP